MLSTQTMKLSRAYGVSDPGTRRKPLASPLRAPPLPAAEGPRRATGLCRATATKDQDLFRWEQVSKYLVEEADIKSVSAQEAKGLGGRFVFLDVRPPDLYEEAHIQGALNAPLWIGLDMSRAGPGEMLRGLAAAVNGVRPMMLNPEFEEDVKSIIQENGGKGFVVYDETGGTLKRTINWPTGKASRSLSAIYKIHSKGLLPSDRILHLDRGIYGWAKDGLPIEGVYDGRNAGRTPGVADEAEINERYLAENRGKQG